MQYHAARQPSPAIRGVAFPPAVLLMALLGIACVDNARADDYLMPIGGGGGGPFEAHCPANQYLVGFDLYAADDVDAIRPLCVVAYGLREVSPPASESNWYGGSGGRFTNVVCPSYTPIVTGMFVAWEGVDTKVVNNIHLFCGEAAGAQVVNDVPSAVFDAPKYEGSGLMHSYSGAGKETQRCPAGQLAVGLHGRSGIWVDAIGLICAPSVLASTGNTVSSIGKIGPPSPPVARRPICEAARDARARNSPAAPNLEAQCEASKTVVTSIGKKPVSGPPKPGPTMSICERARDARARNSPAAPNLEAQCLASGGIIGEKP